MHVNLLWSLVTSLMSYVSAIETMMMKMKIMIKIEIKMTCNAPNVHTTLFAPLIFALTKIIKSDD